MGPNRARHALPRGKARAEAERKAIADAHKIVAINAASDGGRECPILWKFAASGPTRGGKARTSG
jgi:hypothetical protein